jgi:hypothetical protein
MPLNEADNKLVVLSELVNTQEKTEHAPVHCAPGQIDESLRLLG